MKITADNKIKNLIVIGDKVLIQPLTSSNRTRSGLYLPPGVQEKEMVQSGIIIKTGPGFVVPSLVNDEDWKPRQEQVQYIPLQAQEGDLAIFLLNSAIEVIYENEKYYVVPQHAILMVEREEDL